MRRLLITGGAGFIGSNFIRYILDKYKDYHIINLDKLTYCGNPANLKGIAKHKNYEFVKGDIANPKLMERLVKNCDVIVNFAAETHVDRSIDDAAAFIKTNVFGTYTLLEAAKKFKTELFIQISTDEVYGSIAKGSFREEDAMKPNSPYSATKASGDLLARSYYTTFGVPVIVTRSSNNFGPYQYPEKVIPLFITNALEDKKVPLYADGMNVRDWLFVEDNCEGIDIVMHKGHPGQAYNIGAGAEITNLELTHIILDILCKDRSLIKFVKDRPGHDKRYSLDITKMKDLGWYPRHDFRSALELAVGWYKKNVSWWKRLVKCRKNIKY
ncbi:MAG: dTDP-glucose 4,6-dehydratase [Candidatus Omnitrophota bacterium]